MTYQEIIVLYKQCKAEREKNKTFDYDKQYQELVKHYIDKKNYKVEHANEIAKKVVEEQQLAWNKKQ